MLCRGHYSERDKRHFPDTHTHDANLLPHLIGITRQLITTSESDIIVTALFMLHTAEHWRNLAINFTRKFRGRSTVYIHTIGILSYTRLESSRFVSTSLDSLCSVPQLREAFTV